MDFKLNRQQKFVQKMVKEFEKSERMIIDYTVAVECKNCDTLYICYKCGECGRRFENGIMIDDGGTTPDESE